MEQKTNLKRIQGEKNLLTKEFPAAKIIEESTTQAQNPVWKIKFPGPEGSHYDKYNWILRVEFNNYPFAFPKVTMDTKIFHPDIEFETGEFCQQMLETDKWVPSKKFHQILSLIMNILQQPSGENNLNKEATELFKTSQKDFGKKVVEMAKKYASK